MLEEMFRYNSRFHNLVFSSTKSLQSYCHKVQKICTFFNKSISYTNAKKFIQYDYCLKYLGQYIFGIKKKSKDVFQSCKTCVFARESPILIIELFLKS
jgi:hypothetical protein